MNREQPAPNRGEVLVVDDDPAVLNMLGSILSKYGYHVRAASNGPQALETAQVRPPDLALLDVNMPQMDGYEVCRQLKANARMREMPVIFISGRGEAADKLKGFAAGGVDYVTKPFQLYEVLARVQTHLTLHRLQQQLHQANADLEMWMVERTSHLEQSVEQLRRSLDGALGVLARLAALRNPHGAGHPSRTAQLARVIGQELGLTGDQIDGLGAAALLCDLGMAGVPEAILLKPGALTPAELTLIRTHPQLGADLAQSLELSWPVDQFILQHHERLDGSGYPAGLKGEEILLEARILAVADVMAALCAPRLHRPALGLEQALAELVSGAGRLYDPRVVIACVQLFKEGGFRFEKG